MGCTSGRQLICDRCGRIHFCPELDTVLRKMSFGKPLNLGPKDGPVRPSWSFAARNVLPNTRNKLQGRKQVSIPKKHIASKRPPPPFVYLNPFA